MAPTTKNLSDYEFVRLHTTIKKNTSNDQYVASFRCADNYVYTWAGYGNAYGNVHKTKRELKELLINKVLSQHEHPIR